MTEVLAKRRQLSLAVRVSEQFDDDQVTSSLSGCLQFFRILLQETMKIFLIEGIIANCFGTD